MNEKTLERKLTKSVKSMGGISLKFHSTYNTGYPDRIIIMPGGVIYWVELKSTGKKPTPKQQLIHEQMRSLNALVYVIDNTEQLDTFLQIAESASKLSLTLLKKYAI